VEIDSHDLGSSAVVFTPDALVRTPKLWMPSTSLHIGNYNAMAILPSGYLPTVVPSYIHSCHYFVSPISLPTRHEPQYAHYCHRLRLMSNNGEWSNRVFDSPADNDLFSDGSTAGINESLSVTVPDDGPDKNSNHPPTGGDVEMTAYALIPGTEMMTPHSYPDEEWRNIWLITTGTDIRLTTPWYYEGFGGFTDYFIGLRKFKATDVPNVLAIHSFVAIGIKHTRVTVILQQDRHYGETTGLILQQDCHYGETTRLILYHCHYCCSRYDKFGSRCIIAYPTALYTLWDVDITSRSFLAYGSLRKFATSAQTLLYERDVGSVSNSLHDALRIDVTTWTQCLIRGRPISSALHTIQLTSTNVVDPWGAIVGVMRSPTYTRPMTTCHTSTWFGYYYYSSAVSSFGPCFSADTIPLHMHSCRCSNHDGGDFPCTVSPNLDGRNEQQKKLEKKHTGYHCTSTNVHQSKRDNNDSTVDSRANKTGYTTYVMMCDVSRKSYGNVMVSHDSCERPLYHVISDLSVSLRCKLGILMHRSSMNYMKFLLWKHCNDTLSTSLNNLLGIVLQRNVKYATSYTSSEVARSYCFDQSSNNGIGSSYKPSRDGKEYSGVISSGGYYWDASALIIKSSLTYYADTQVCMRTMHNSHLMHLVRPQDHGEPIGCILRWRRKNGGLIDCIVKPRKHGERIVCTITPQHSLFHRDVAIHIIATRIESITETSSIVDDNINSYMETIGVKVCVIGDSDVNVDNNITNGDGKSYANGPDTYGHYCAVWKAQNKPSSLMSDTSVTSYADIRTSPSPCTITRRLLRLLLIWIQPFETPLIEGNCRSIDSDAVYAWTTLETGAVDLDVEVEEHDLTDDTNIPSCASLVNGEQLMSGMTKETGTNSIQDNVATIDRPLLDICKHLMRQPMKRRFGGLIYMSMQQLMNLAQYCSSHEHHIIMIVLCMNLAPIIVPLSQYDASTNATKMELRVHAIRKDITPLDGQNNNSSSTSMGRYDIVDSGTRSSDTVVGEHLMPIEGEQPYEGITLSDLRTRLVFADDVFNSGLSVPTVDLHSTGTLPKIEKSCSYLGSLSSECMPQHLNELYRNDPISPGHTHDATIVNFSSNTQPKNAANTVHLMLSDNSAIENNASGTSGFNAVIKYWAYQAISTWLILQPTLFLNRDKLKLVSTAGNTTTLNGHQTFGRLMGSHGLQYHIDRTNGTNRRGVTNECIPHVDTDSISTIDASTFREYWYSKRENRKTRDKRERDGKPLIR
jgi:hypothetical protein